MNTNKKGDFLSASDTSMQKDEFITFQSTYPENEIVKLIDSMFLMYDRSIENGKTQKAKYIDEYIQHLIGLLKNTIGPALELNKLSGSDENHFLGPGCSVPSSMKAFLDEAFNSGSLLKHHMMERYLSLKKQYALKKHESEIKEIPIVFRKRTISKFETRIKFFDVYRYLYQNHFKFISSGVKGQLIDSIEDLRIALNDSDDAESLAAIEQARNLLKPISVYNIHNVRKGKTVNNSILISGIGHPFIEFCIRIENENDRWEGVNFIVKGDSSFKTQKINLKRGDNLVKLIPVGIPELLMDRKLSWEIRVEKQIARYLLGLIDGPTKKDLTQVPLEKIILCSNTSCNTYSLKISWDAFNACPICSHGEYYSYDHPKFELESK